MSRHPRNLLVCLALLLLFASGGEIKADSASTPPSIKWSKGPVDANLGDIAEIQVPEGYLFADGNGARKFLELTHNPASGAEVGLIVPSSDQEDWYVLFEFNGVGYVKDDDRNSLDATAILTNIQKSTEESNEERRKRGWKAFHVTGWYTTPYYDSATNNLTWAVTGSEDNNENPAVNYSIRILGRRGTMNVDLVLDPSDLAGVEPRFKTLISGFRFVEGNRYADFTEGDKMAGYGLTALIAGGVTAVAIKTGLFAKLWKFLVLICAAIAGAIKKMWRKTKEVVGGEVDLKEQAPGPDPNVK